ncbi:MAG: hypothetical protein KDB68_15040 [Planctomycetes bacterium]|nr:hypothetical protein [Planctomycetota bacterium]MCA8937510.1 hypothetical protein [Planctomycetota bacterium]
MSATIIDEPEKFSFPTMVKLGCFAAIAVGLITFGLSFIGGSDVAFGGWAIASWYVVGFPLFAMFFLSINHLANAGWHVTLKRVPEAMTTYFLPGLLTFAVLCLSFLSTGDHQLYGWAHLNPDHHDAHTELIQKKAGWLNVPFFLIRTGIYFGLWTAFAWAIVRVSRKQDEDGDYKHTFTARKLAAVFSIVFGLSVTFASIDFIKSVEPTWFSTMFGVYQFAGIIESGFAMLILLLLLLRKLGYFKSAVNVNHFHNLGIWLFASATFWAYIWFSQFMLIWYSNIPEETAHFVARWNGPWFWVSFALNPIVNWVVIFFLLLPRPNKRNPKILAIAAVSALIGRFIDLWQFVTPTPHNNAEGVPEAHLLPQAMFWQILIVVGLIGFFLLVTLKALEKAPLLAKKDPYFEESVHHHI